MSIYSPLAGFTSGGAPSVLTSGRTIWVDSATGDDARAALDPYNRYTPFATITAALAASAPFDAVLVFAGVYPESFTIPPGVLVEGVTDDASVTHVSGGAPTGARVTLSLGSVLRNLKVSSPSDAAAAVECPDGVSAEVQSLQLIGGGASSYGMRKSGAGVLLFREIRLRGGAIGSVIRYDGVGGALVGEDIICAETSTVDAIMDGAGIGMLKFRTVTASLPCVFTDGIRASAGMIIKSGEGSILDAVNAVHITGDGVNFDCARLALGSSAFDVLIDPAVTTLPRFVLTGARFDYQAVSIPQSLANGPTLYLEGADTQSASPGKLIAGDLDVGTFRAGRSATIGGGGPHTIGMEALANDNLEAGTWTNNTAAARDRGATPFVAFSSTAIGAAFYIGGVETFPAFEVDVSSARVGGTMVWEYWNGATWAALPIMVTSVEQTRKEEWALLAEVQETRFLEPLDWSTKALDGLTRYWIRARASVAMTTAPTLLFASLFAAAVRFDVAGHSRYFGAAAPLRRMSGIDIASLIPISGAATTDQPINISPSISFDTLRNDFNNNAVDRAGGLFVVPNGLDTSRPIELTFRWAPAGAQTGNVEWVAIVATTAVGATLDGTAPELTQSKIRSVAAPAQNVVQAEESFDFTLSDLEPGDQVAIVISRDATGGNPNDTLAGAVYLVDIAVSAHIWSE